MGWAAAPSAAGDSQPAPSVGRGPPQSPFHQDFNGGRSVVLVGRQESFRRGPCLNGHAIWARPTEEPPQCRKRTDSSRRSAAIFAATAAIAASISPAIAHADAAHYYIEIGGTGGAAAPACTRSPTARVDQLNGGIAVPVCYPASLFPFVGSHNGATAPLARPTSTTVRTRATTTCLERDRDHLPPAPGRTHHDHRILPRRAGRGRRAPDDRERRHRHPEVTGRRHALTADPQQPGTGIWAKIPKGVSAFGATSPDPAR